MKHIWGLMKGEIMLEIDRASVRYGAVEAVSGVSITLASGQIGALIGANGAGKSSLLSAISGLVPLAEGSIRYRGSDISKTAIHKRPGLGVGHVLEGHRVFNDQSVMRNLMLGGITRFSKKQERQVASEEINRQFERFPILAERQHQLAGTLSGGEQQMLAIATSLMANPSLLLIDEPSLGLAPKIVNEVFESIFALKEEGITVLLVEQTVELALSVADYGWVLQRGNLVMEGTAEELRGNELMQSAYLG